ncbi:MBL fold metallo-hydrolase [Desulfoferula mesophila]|uniref:Metallo-beta-lactamase domain-containing protein n=1 Tax=Desulfoferula mesophila TaxID=3058419 RepID=A0AAU9ECE7_9BACT|nr:hypothetical protein FAK_00250 [Desulfoferula mesophilus]
MSSQIPRPIQLSDNLYQLGTMAFPVYLSLGRVAMLIEGGTGATAEIIARQVQMLGIDPGRIAYMALTHTHADHIGAVPRLRRLWPGMKILAGPKAAEMLAHPKHVERFLPADRMISKILLGQGVIDEMPPMLEDYDFRVDAVLGEGARIDLGEGVVWHILLTPGHSPCHVAYFEERDGVVALGDLAGYCDFEREIIWPNYFHSLEEYCLSMQKLAILPGKLALLSHNGSANLLERPLLEQAVAATLEYHHRLLERLGAGESLEELCQEQAAWVYSYAPIASVKAIEFLVGQLCGQSRRMATLNQGPELGWSLAGGQEAGASAGA